MLGIAPQMMAIILLSLLSASLLIVIITDEKNKKEVTREYIDTRGVQDMPPRYFDVKRHATLNIKIDEKHVMIIPPMKPEQYFVAKAKLAGYVDVLNKTCGRAEYTSKLYMGIIVECMKLGINWKFASRRAFMLRALKDVEFIDGIVEQFFRYHEEIEGKKKRILAMLTGEAPTTGAPSTSDLYAKALEAKRQTK